MTNDTFDFYVAEDVAREETADEWPDDQTSIEPDQVEEFVRRTLAAAGWSGDGCPTFSFEELDASDDGHELSAWTDGPANVIHVDPRTIDRWLVLHEVAHWLRPTDAHGPQYAAVLIGLIAAGIGPGPADVLQRALLQEGIDVDEQWLTV